MPTKDDIELHERLARIETLLLANDVDHNEIKELLKHVLSNDKDKLERITVLEQKLKHLKATMYIFLVPLGAGIARWFI